MRPPGQTAISKLLGKGIFLWKIARMIPEVQSGKVRSPLVEKATRDKAERSHVKLRQKLKVGTWNVRIMNQGRDDKNRH